MAEPFRGAYTVLVTPFSAAGAQVAPPALERLIGFQIAEGSDGLMTFASTGGFLAVDRGMPLRQGEHARGDAGAKAALEISGCPIGPSRPPRLELPREDWPALQAALDEMSR